MTHVFSPPLMEAPIRSSAERRSSPALRPVPPALTPAARVALRHRAYCWLAGLAPLLCVAYGLTLRGSARVQASPFWAGLPYAAVLLLMAWSLLRARHQRELDRHGARLLTALFSTAALGVALGFGDAEAPQRAPALHFALVLILWDWFNQRIHTPGKRLLLHSAAVWAAVAGWTSHELPPDDAATEVFLGTLAAVVSLWMWPLARRVSMPQAWRPGRHRRRTELALLYAAASLLCFAAALIGIAGATLALAWPAATLAAVALNYAGLGARGFQLDRHGRMAWAARWLFAPYRLAAALHAWLWNRGTAPAFEIRPGLWLARVPSQREWLAAGRPLLLSLCAELQAPGGGATRCLPLLDQTRSSRADLRRAGLTLEALMATRHPVWVCSARGFSLEAAMLVGWRLERRRRR